MQRKIRQPDDLGLVQALGILVGLEAAAIKQADTRWGCFEFQCQTDTSRTCSDNAHIRFMFAVSWEGTCIDDHAQQPFPHQRTLGKRDAIEN